MNAQILIDSVVRQTMVLIAELATAGGLRAPLAHVANQVFLDHANELERQGVSRKVAADMFGLALRGYQRRIQRAAESATDRGHSLWEAVLAYVGSGAVRTRAQVLERFRKDDEALVRGVLHDLVESGLVFSSGAGIDTAYRAATEGELGEMHAASSTGLDELIWVVVYREGPVTAEDLSLMAKISVDDVGATLERLEASGRVRAVDSGAERRYTSGEFFVPLGSGRGWEAAVLDHFQAIVQTICVKLRGRSTRADLTGGSTYTFIVWPGHPHEETVCSELRLFRERRTALRAEVDAYNREHGIPAQHVKVVSYAGQCAIDGETPAGREDG